MVTSAPIRLGCLASGAPEDSRLEALADGLGLDRAESAGDSSFTHLLGFRAGKLCLSANRPRPPAPTCVDFGDPALEHRRVTSGKSQGVGLAVGVKKLGAPLVLDATAGLGRDAFIVASLGCRVQLLERSAVIHALLEDGFRRGREAGGEVTEILQRMSLHHGDAGAWLSEVAEGERERPDVVYLDPMFPPRGNTAKVKKDISLLQELLGVDEDFDELLERARRAARHRVVVKRPGRASRDGDPAPNFQVRGRASHFDVYLPIE